MSTPLKRTPFGRHSGAAHAPLGRRSLLPSRPLGPPAPLGAPPWRCPAAEARRRARERERRQQLHEAAGAVAHDEAGREGHARGPGEHADQWPNLQGGPKRRDTTSTSHFNVLLPLDASSHILSSTRFACRPRTAASTHTWPSLTAPMLRTHTD